MWIDPGTVQLLFADAQVSLVDHSRTAEPAMIAKASGVLALCAEFLDLPVSFSVAEQPGGTPPLLDALRPRAAPQRVFARHSASPFTDARLVAALQANNRPALVIAGFASEVVVLHAALDAIKAGYEVLLPLDAIGSLSARTEAAAIRQVERAGGTATSVASLVTMMQPDFHTQVGSRVIEAVRGLSS
jgi:nicotinamidase-related amidase